jgi:hypothetical protein
MSSGGFLDGAYWFEFFTILSVIMALVVPIMDREHDLDVGELLKAARLGRLILVRQANKSMAATRCWQILAVSRYPAPFLPRLIREACKYS